MKKARKKPTVFISSTCFDLSQQREDLKDFFENDYGFNTMLSEFNSFPIDPCVGTFENCLNNVDNYADIFILIIGTRYGHETEQGKSVTNLEYLHAKTKNIPIFIFISKQLYNTLPVWRKNPNGDFSNLTDNAKLFEFVSEIYNEANQWIYTYDSVKDIKKTMKNQLALIFSDGLAYRKLITSPQYSFLNNDLPAGAIRALTEKPFAWEFKFFAHIIKEEFNKIKSKKWDFEYGIFDDFYSVQNPKALLDFISDKLNEIQNICEMLNTLINSTISDALCVAGNCDLEKILYSSRRIASIYIKLVNWALYFKSIKAENEFSKLLNLLYNLPKNILVNLEKFVNDIFNEMMTIPDVDDNLERKINLNLTLSIPNIVDITKEIDILSNMIINGLII